MNDFEKPDPVGDARLVAREVKEWEQHLNEIAGLMGFTFSLAALGTPVPQFWGGVSLIFLFLFHYISSKSKMTKLRNLERKKDKTDYDEWVIREIRKTIKVLNTPVFLFGFGLLFLVSFAPDMFMQNTWLLEKLYGDSPYSTASAAVEKLLAYLFR